MTKPDVPVHYFRRRNWRGVWKYYFHVKAANGEILCQSQGYASKQMSEYGFDALIRRLNEQGYFL